MSSSGPARTGIPETGLRLPDSTVRGELRDLGIRIDSERPAPPQMSGVAGREPHEQPSNACGNRGAERWQLPVGFQRHPDVRG